MMDIVRKNGDKINVKKLSETLGCEIIEISALKGEGGFEAAQKAVEAAEKNRMQLRFTSLPEVLSMPSHILRSLSR